MWCAANPMSLKLVFFTSPSPPHLVYSLIIALYGYIYTNYVCGYVTKMLDVGSGRYINFDIFAIVRIVPKAINFIYLPNIQQFKYLWSTLHENHKLSTFISGRQSPRYALIG